MNATKKLTACLLAAIMTASVLSACSNGDDSGSGEIDRAPTTTEAAIEETEADTRVYPTHLPEVTYGGYEFKMSHWMFGEGYVMTFDLDSEGENGDLINDTVYKRNSKIEEQYEVIVTGIYQELGELDTAYRNAVNAGDNTYDVIFVRSHEAGSYAASGYYLDLNRLEAIDWSMPWWDQQSVAELSLGDRLFMVQGDVTLMDKSATACMYFNRKLQSDWNVENFYQLVLEDKWTWDKMIDISKSVHEDVDGNSEWDESDIWGLGAGDDITYMLLHAGGGRYASKDSDDLPIVEFGSERTLTVAQRTLDILYDDSYFYHGGNSDMFQKGNLLLLMDLIKKSMEMREFEDYGIIPLPKFDEAQENYGATVSIHHSPVLTVPKTAPEEAYERTGVLLEALAAESCYTVIDVYYDTVLKVKGTRDEQSAAMLDIIFDNRVYDLGEFYQFGDFNTQFLRTKGNGHEDVVSLYEKHSKYIQKAIDALIKKLDKYDA
ncbi:MAG: extracellular solute-binding protein [Clostridia bacterium]|nr:extracellular solute-binding protein [Clostridia bacterium]